MLLPSEEGKEKDVKHNHEQWGQNGHTRLVLLTFEQISLYEFLTVRVFISPF